MEDSRLIPGICPQCGGRLQIPAELRHFSCLYCGARLDLAELLPEPSQTERVPAAEAQEAYDFAAAHLPECVTAYPRALRHLTKGEFEPYFQGIPDGLPACVPKDSCRRAGHAPAGLGSGADCFVRWISHTAGGLARQAQKRPQRPGRSLDDMKFTICLFLIPLYPPGEQPGLRGFLPDFARAVAGAVSRQALPAHHLSGHSAGLSAEKAVLYHHRCVQPVGQAG